MLKRFLHLLGLAWPVDGESKINKELIGPSPNKDEGSEITEVGTSISLDLCLQLKNIFVRIVHTGGREKLYQNAVPASRLMDKHLGICVARPKVFKNPQDPFLRPEDSLLPSQKYYIAPFTTAQKLMRKHQKKAKAKEPCEGKEDTSDGKISMDAGGSDTDDYVGSAKEYYVSKDSWSRRLRRKGIKGKMPFIPPLPKDKIMQRTGMGALIRPISIPPGLTRDDPAPV